METKKTRLSCNIYLIGFMGAGKSAAARTLQKAYGMELVEMDETIEAQQGMKISEIFARKGEPYFRQLETELLQGLREVSNRVISCGGGVVMRPENVALMKENGRIVLLTATPETILERVSRNNNRPLLEGKKNVADIRALMETRRPFYEAAADFCVSTDDCSRRQVAEKILQGLEDIALS